MKTKLERRQGGGNNSKTLESKLKRLSIVITLILIVLTSLNAVNNIYISNKIIKLNTRMLPHQYGLQNMLNHITQIKMFLMPYVSGDITQKYRIIEEQSRYRSARKRLVVFSSNVDSIDALDKKVVELDQLISNIFETENFNSGCLYDGEKESDCSEKSKFENVASFSEFSEINEKYFEDIVMIIFSLLKDVRVDNENILEDFYEVQNGSLVAYLILAAAFVFSLFWFYRYLRVSLLEPIGLIIENVNLLSNSRELKPMNLDSLEFVKIEASLTKMCSDLAELELYRKQQLDDAERQRFTEVKLLVDDLERFVHIASHDLRAPLKKIYSLCEILFDDDSDLTEKEQEEVVNEIKRETAQAIDLIGDLSNYTFATSMQSDYSEVDMKLVLKGLEKKMSEKLEAEGAVINLDDSDALTVFGSELLIRLLLGYFIDNAIKYGGYPLKIDFSHAMGSDDHPEHFFFSNSLSKPMSVADNSLLKPFVRGDNTYKKEGTGMGLAICQRIVIRHGGMIWIDSSDSSRFKVCFTLS